MPRAVAPRPWILLIVALVAALVVSIAAAVQTEEHEDDHAHDADTGLTEYVADYRFILRTSLTEGGFAFVGVGGDIDGQVNPLLEVTHDAIVEIVLINGDGIEHDIDVAEFGAMSGHVTQLWETTVVAFRADEEGALNYICTIPGHVEAGMIGQLVVEDGH
jgi:nitrite reductase (NO-forming)